MRGFTYLGLFMWAALVILVVGGCAAGGEGQQAAATTKLVDEATKQVGMPAVTKFTERRQLKQIYELRDDAKLICYAYIQSEYDGKLHFLTKCLGYGIPYATQFSNPMRYDSIRGLMPQAEPNGLYMPDQADATWLMVPDKNGNAVPMYCEPKIVVSPQIIETAQGNPAS